MTDPKLLEKIRKLLAMAEGSDNEHEADAHLAKAKQLMLQHAITEADLPKEKREKLTTRQVVIGAAIPDAELWWAVTKWNSVKALRFRNHWYPEKTFMKLWGFESDLDFVELLGTSLTLQRETALQVARKETYGRGRSFNHSFRVGYSDRINWRLFEVYRKEMAVTEKASPGAELVVANRGKQAELAMKSAHPKVNKIRSAEASSSLGNHLGDRAARTADISGGRGHVANQKGIEG